jgi:hypothetical protein
MRRSIVFSEPLPVSLKMLLDFSNWELVTKDYCVHTSIFLTWSNGHE